MESKKQKKTTAAFLCGKNCTVTKKCVYTIPIRPIAVCIELILTLWMACDPGTRVRSLQIKLKTVSELSGFPLITIFRIGADMKT